MNFCVSIIKHDPQLSRQPLPPHHSPAARLDALGVLPRRYDIQRRHTQSRGRPLDSRVKTDFQSLIFIFPAHRFVRLVENRCNKITPPQNSFIAFAHCTALAHGLDLLPPTSATHQPSPWEGKGGRSPSPPPFSAELDRRSDKPTVVCRKCGAKANESRDLCKPCSC